MNYLSIIGAYAPSAVLGAAEGVKKYLRPESNAAARGTNRTKEVWVDPICALIALAILQKESFGTKLSFDDNEISFDQPLPFQAQSYIRCHKRSSRNDLYNLTPAIYYSIKWLNIAENEKYTIILEMAKRGISQMINSTYRDDLQLQQYLTTTHLRMLNDGLDKKEILREEFMIPAHDENPLNTRSKSYWSSDQLDRLSKQLSEFKESGREDVVKPLLVRKIQEISQKHKEYLLSVRAGRPTSLEEQCTDDNIILVDLGHPERRGSEDLPFIEDTFNCKTKEDFPSEMPDAATQEEIGEQDEKELEDDF